MSEVDRGRFLRLMVLPAVGAVALTLGIAITVLVVTDSVGWALLAWLLTAVAIVVVGALLMGSREFKRLFITRPDGPLPRRGWPLSVVFAFLLLGGIYVSRDVSVWAALPLWILAGLSFVLRMRASWRRGQARARAMRPGT